MDYTSISPPFHGSGTDESRVAGSIILRGCDTSTTDNVPDETLLCPGHRPLTTVAQEKAHNPFFGGE